MTSTGRRGTPILDGAETAVAAARVAVSSATRSAFRRGLAQLFTPPPPPPDFHSALAPSSPPAHTGRPGPLPSPLPLSARLKQPETSKSASRVLASPAFNHATPYPVRATPLSADACGPDRLRPTPQHQHKEEPC